MNSYDWRNSFEQLIRIQQAHSIACYKAAQGVSNDAHLVYLVSLILQLFYFALNLVCRPLASQLNAIVREAIRITLRN